MVLEARPQLLDRVQVRGIWRQVCQLDCAVLAGHVRAHLAAAVSLEAIPEDQQRLLQVSAHYLQELNDFWRVDRPFVQAKAVVGQTQTGCHRQLLPLEVAVDHRC